MLAQYLSHDVFNQQPPQIQSFLLATSILKRLEPSLCQALLPDAPCAAILAELTAADVLLAPEGGDQQGFRYRTLFASYLQARLRAAQPQTAQALHLRASAWYAARQRPVPAIDHALDGGDFACAARMLEHHGLELLGQGRIRLLARWLRQLPRPALESRPLLLAIRIWSLCFTHGPAQALSELDALAMEIGDHVIAGAWWRPAAALRPILLAMLDRHEESYQTGMVILAQPDTPAPFTSAVLVNAMANTAGILGKYDQARALLDTARAGLQAGPGDFHAMYSEAVEGVIDLLAGRFRQAHARFQLAVRATHAGTQANGNAWAGVLYAVALYESGQLTETARLLDIYMPLGRDAGLADHLILGHVMLARMALQRGCAEQAFVTLGELEYLGHHRRLPRMAASARLERARILLLQGHSQAARDELRRAHNPDLWASMRELHLPANDLSYPALAELRWEAYAGNAEHAALALNHAWREARRQGRERRALKLQLIASVALARAGNLDAADAVLTGVLDHACQEAVYGLIVDEAGPLAECLKSFARRRAGALWCAANPDAAPALQRWRTGLAASQQAYAGRTSLLAGADSRQNPPREQALRASLTAKEFAVLALLADGLSNAGMAHRLHVSESTVRSHLRSLNTKLAASSRTQALAIARRAGLIS